MMFARTNAEHSPLSFTERLAKFQVPVPVAHSHYFLLIFVHSSPTVTREAVAL